MKISYSFDITNVGSLKGRLTVFFFGTYLASEEEIFRAVDGHYSENPSSDHVIFLTSDRNVGAIKNALNTSRVRERIHQYGNQYTGENLIIVSYDYKGTLINRPLQNGAAESEYDSEMAEIIKQHGCIQFFRTYNGMLEASESHHYVKPSLKHTDRFIRTGSVLVNGVEIEFLGMWLLPILKESVSCIYTDSSTINSVAYAVVHLRNSLDPNRGNFSPAIQSYESYKGLNKSTIVDKKKSIVLVSASTGGAMLKEIVDKYRVSADQVSTLFYLGTDRPVGNIVCDLTEREGLAGGYRPATVTKPGDRGGFPPNSLAVHILAEAFVPENPQVEAINIIVDDIPKWWEAFKHSFLGRNAIVCNFPSPVDTYMSTPPPRPVVVSLVEALKSNTVFSKRMNQIILNSLPASLKTVIHFGDDSTRAIVARIKKAIKVNGFEKETIKFLEVRKVTQSGSFESTLQGEVGSTLVVSAALTDSDQLLDVAQIARTKQKNHALCFLIGLSGCSSEKAFKELRSNLVYSQSGIEYGFHCGQAIIAPEFHRSDLTCWAEELRFWMKLLSKDRSNDDANVSRIVKDRVSILQNGMTKGLTNNLYLERPSNVLKLRPNSIFTTGLKQDMSFSQADMFFATQSTLHNMRNRLTPFRKLVQQPHRRTVLSPAVFYRFSDGVIQASLLRAAAHCELDYQMSPELSRQMANTLMGMFQNPTNPRAEALTEFLFAMASKKLRLLKEDQNAAIICIERGIGGRRDFSLEKYLCRLIKEPL